MKEILYVHVVNFLFRGWIRSIKSHGSVALPLLESPESVEYNISKDLGFFFTGQKGQCGCSFMAHWFPIGRGLACI